MPPFHFLASIWEKDAILRSLWLMDFDVLYKAAKWRKEYSTAEAPYCQLLLGQCILSPGSDNQRRMPLGSISQRKAFVQLLHMDRWPLRHWLLPWCMRSLLRPPSTVTLGLFSTFGVTLQLKQISLSLHTFNFICSGSL